MANNFTMEADKKAAEEAKKKAEEAEKAAVEANKKEEEAARKATEDRAAAEAAAKKAAEEKTATEAAESVIKNAEEEEAAAKAAAEKVSAEAAAKRAAEEESAAEAKARKEAEAGVQQAQKCIFHTIHDSDSDQEMFSDAAADSAGFVQSQPGEQAVADALSEESASSQCDNAIAEDHLAVSDDAAAHAICLESMSGISEEKAAAETAARKAAEEETVAEAAAKKLAEDKAAAELADRKRSEEEVAAELAAKKKTEEEASKRGELDTAEEPVFEIRDFSAVSHFERLSHRISLILRRWATELVEAVGSPGGLGRSYTFDHAGENCELSCLHSSAIFPKALWAQPSGVQSSFAAVGAHRLERWFGTSHSATLSIGIQCSVDLDTARSGLSALILAASMREAALREATAVPLACFVIVEGGRWQRLLGEGRVGTERTLYCTDRAGFVGEEFRAGHAATIKLYRERFTLERNMRVQLVVRQTFAARMRHAGAPGSPVERGRDHSRDPLRAIQLEGEGHEVEEGEPELQWKIRIFAAPATTTTADTAVLRMCTRLRNLMAFRPAARTLRSLDQWPTLPSSASSDSADVKASSANQAVEAGALEELATSILEASISPSGATGSARARSAAPRDSLLARFAVCASSLPDLRTVLALWSLILGRLRLCMDGAADLLAASYSTWRICTWCRSVRIGVSHCLVQQKLELFGVCLSRRAQSAVEPAPRSVPTTLMSVATGAPLVGPPLLPARLLTEDTQAEWDVALSAMDGPEERAAFACAEFCCDACAFKAANPGASLHDFLQWRLTQSLDGNASSAGLPEDWEQRAWDRAEPRPAIEQSPLFDPELEAEKVLHSLESADVMGFLEQIFRICLWTSLDEIFSTCDQHEEDADERSNEQLHSMDTLKHLRAESEAAAAQLLSTSTSEFEACSREEALKRLASTCRRAEEAVQLALALQAKLRLLGVPADGESGRSASTLGSLLAAASSEETPWQVLECPLACASSSWRPALPAPVREYLLTAVENEALSSKGDDCDRETKNPPLKPGSLYIEVGKTHVRLAASHNVSLV